MKKQILVTGAAGYIGSVLVRQLLARGYRVLGIDRLLFGDHGVRDLAGEEGFEFVEADLRSADAYSGRLGEVDGIVHLAAIVGDPACAKEPDLARETNLDASLRLFEAAAAAGVGRFVFASTCSNYGRSEEVEYCTEDSLLRPLSLYAETKVEVERRLLDSDAGDLSATCLRFATAYGPSPRMRFDLTVNEFSRDMFSGRTLEIFGQQFWRPYCHTTDIARACIDVLAADRAVVGRRVFNVGNTKENYTKKDLADLLLELRPDADIQFVHKKEDPRDYKVAFERIADELGFVNSMTVPEGVREIFSLLEADAFPSPHSARYSNTGAPA